MKKLKEKCTKRKQSKERNMQTVMQKKHDCKMDSEKTLQTASRERAPWAEKHFVRAIKKQLNQ